MMIRPLKPMCPTCGVRTEIKILTIAERLALQNLTENTQQLEHESGFCKGCNQFVVPGKIVKFKAGKKGKVTVGVTPTEPASIPSRK